MDPAPSSSERDSASFLEYQGPWESEHVWLLELDVGGVEALAKVIALASAEL